MGLSKRSVSKMIVLCIISTVFTLYTVSAHLVARFIYEGEGGIFWTVLMGGGWFLPWPGPFLLLGLGRHRPLEGGFTPIESEVTIFIYRYLIKTWVLVGVSILMWAIIMYKARIISRLRALPW